MNAMIVARTPTSFTLQVEVPYSHSMLDFEGARQHRLNEAGVIGSAEGLNQFDTDGVPITAGAVKLTSKRQIEKEYQTPYGVATVARHVYRSPQGGPTYCPLDRDARIVVTATPRFAKILSHKYAEFSSPRAQIDLKENHGRVVSRCLIQDVADAVAAAALTKEEDWSYTLPKFQEPPATVAISLDGTCLLIRSCCPDFAVSSLSLNDLPAIRAAICSQNLSGYALTPPRIPRDTERHGMPTSHSPRCQNHQHPQRRHLHQLLSPTLLPPGRKGQARDPRQPLRPPTPRHRADQSLPQGRDLRPGCRRLPDPSLPAPRPCRSCPGHDAQARL